MFFWQKSQISNLKKTNLISDNFEFWILSFEFCFSGLSRLGLAE
jgi:hypothetical protein